MCMVVGYTPLSVFLFLERNLVMARAVAWANSILFPSFLLADLSFCIQNMLTH